MSTKYCKISVRVDAADDANYSTPIWSAQPPSLASYEVQATKIDRFKMTAPITASYLTLMLETMGYTAANIRSIIVKNLDATNFVTFNYCTAGSTAAVIPHKIFPNGFHIASDIYLGATTDAKPATFQANTAACEIEVIIVSV